MVQRSGSSRNSVGADASELKIVGASEHNLKNLNLQIPHDRLIGLTGLSGSGKSSLAFDTIYAEGQRRFLETFSPYVRQFFSRFKQPQVEIISNVRPTLAVQQRTRIRSSRSTVGTLTHINDLLKILWSNIAMPNCPGCGVSLEHWQPGALAAHLAKLLDMKPHVYFIVSSPLVRREQGLLAELERLRILGFDRLLDLEKGSLRDLDSVLEEGPGERFERFLVALSRVRRKDLDEGQLRDSLAQAFKMGQQQCVVVEVDGNRRSFRGYLGLDNVSTLGSWSLHRFSQVPSCPVKDFALKSPRPALFTFNHPLGACEACKGFGANLEVDLERCIPDTDKSLNEGAIVCWTTEATQWERTQLQKFCKRHSIDMDRPWNELSKDQRDLVLRTRSKAYWGLLPWFDWLESKKYKLHVRVFLSKYKTQRVCAECGGKRLKSDALAYKIDGCSLPDLWSKPLGELLLWIQSVRSRYDAEVGVSRPLAEVFEAIERCLDCMVRLGLAYLTLDRAARTLSGGETQRVNLANALGSDLVSAHFILDEPSVGLHARDSQRLAEAIRDLSSRGNSVLMVEHDPDLILSADGILELGPEAGFRGGEVIYNGDVKKWKGFRVQKVEPRRRDFCSFVEVLGASAHNIFGLSVEIPLNGIVCLTGVSGSGKSTLLHEIISKGWETKDPLVRFPEEISEVLCIDQSALVKSPRANVATYTKVWDVLRSMLAATEDASSRGITKSMFSFNVDGGRCGFCKGSGYIKEDMQFLSDVFVPCEVCGGERFEASVLEVRMRGRNVSEWLRTSIDECVEIFNDHPVLLKRLSLLQILGLGYMSLGHSLAHLSGGEAQRLKLVPVLEQGDGNSLLLFDEPTTGLHVDDVIKLVELFKILRDRGNSIICVAHHLTLIAHSDWIVDLGPEGGSGGGRVVEQGNPHDVAKREQTETAKALVRFFKSQGRCGGEVRVRKSAKPQDKLVLSGAREHNLKNINVEIPHGKMVAVTGVSGSGKSTIARDIVHAEAQHQYLSCLSPYARQFVNTLSRPDVDKITGLQPTICISQHTFQPSALSTVSTVSEVYHFFRLLYAKIGQQYCVDHPSKKVGGADADEIVVRLKQSAKGKIARVLSPVVQHKKGTHQAVIRRAIELEIDEIRVDGVYGSPAVWIDGLDRRSVHTIEFVLFKGKVARVPDDLLRAAADAALRMGSGDVIVDDGLADERFSLDRSCPKCGRGYSKPDPEDLSFNSRRGRCSSCSGAGRTNSGALCRSCKGARINARARHLRLGSHSIADLCGKKPSEVKCILDSLSVADHRSALALPLFSEIRSRLQTLIDLGLDYLSLDRDCRTLSGGELQRVRLATVLGSSLAGVMYIFDEPSIGLHPDDNVKVLRKLRLLQEGGNSVLVIEHDPQSILACDAVLEVGPEGGRQGGEVVFSGDLAGFLGDSKSITARHISQHGEVEKAQERAATHFLHVGRASVNNLKEIDVRIPLRQLVSVIGVSGAGKSSLIKGVVEECFARGKETKGVVKIAEGWVKSDLAVDRVLRVDQKPIGANSRSTPVSYLGVWDPIRKLFAQTLEAKGLGWSAKHFSYNAGDGRCPECSGQGTMKLEMSFLPDARVTCSTCRGSRFRDEVREVKYLGLAIDEVLELTFDEARQVFANHRKIHQILNCACELGLGYLTLGQSATSLSGGESQRIKLVLELSKRTSGHTLYLLDEPTTGLHLSDISRLIQALHRLVDAGASVIIVEHELEVVKQSDWIIELGPGAGDDGGRVVFEGPPSLLGGNESAWGRLCA